mmetsp:Transcript_23478/g.64729  ORF Transcript_23478/g.64729 Transcript_23478/m.64729 type:complete len:526 (-) Transcript_23478:1867-3444(-)
MLGYRGKGIRLSTPFSQTKGHRELLSRFATKVLVRNGVAAPVQRKWEPVEKKLASRKGAVKGTPTREFPLYVGLGSSPQALLRSCTDNVALLRNLRALKSLNGVSGIAVDIYWGLVEDAGPKEYNWSRYKQLLHDITSLGFKLKIKLCFNSTDGISLPPWVLELGRHYPDIFYTDKAGARSKECLTLGIDDVPVLHGRTGQEVYYDFMCSFRDEFSSLLGSSISSILIGLGPNGELKYPSHPSDPQLWEYPGHGEFQCYDQSMLATLKASAEHAEPLWGLGGPHDAGQYKEWPQQCGFFTQKGNWRSSYGRFFLQWYSEMLIRHAVLVMGAASDAFSGSPVRLSARIPSCHWWSETDSHAAELTAGYYHTAERNGYFLPFKALSQFKCSVHMGIAEARSQDGRVSCCSNPEKMLLTQRAVAAALHMPVCVETRELMLDDASLVRMEEAIFKPISSLGIELPPVDGLVMNSMCDAMFEPEGWQRFSDFVHKVATRYEAEASYPLSLKYDSLNDPDNHVTSNRAGAN